jgi:hypothetical protein
MNFIDKCKYIINENKEASGNKKDIICDQEINETPEEAETEQEEIKDDEQEETETPVDEMDEVELDFFNKFVELTELECLIKANEVIKKSFKSIIGENKKSIDELLEKRLNEQKEKVEQLKTELSDIRNNIKDEETKKVNTAERKLGLISLLDKAIQ